MESGDFTERALEKTQRDQSEDRENLPGLVSLYWFCNADRRGVNSNLSQLQQCPGFRDVPQEKEVPSRCWGAGVCQAHTRCKLGRVIGILKNNKSVIQHRVTDNILWALITGKITSMWFKSSISNGTRINNQTINSTKDMIHVINEVVRTHAYR